MSEELELTGGSAGIDRRDFIRKSAIVGGMVWAAPLVQSIGSPAFAGTPITGENGVGDCDISAIQIYLTNDGAARYKYEFNFVNGMWVVTADSASAPPCVANITDGRQLFDEWCAADAGVTGLNVNVTAVSPNEEKSKALVTVDDSGVYGNYYLEWLVIKSGAECYLVTYDSKTTRSDTVTCGDGTAIGFAGSPVSCP